LFASASQLIIDHVYGYFNADPENAYFFASNNVLCSREQFLALGGFDRSFPRPGAEDRDFCDRWRMAGWPLIWRPGAYVEHRHPQPLPGFINLHARYGRGAYLYQARRRQRGSGTMQDDFGFHRTLPSRISLYFAQRIDPILWKVGLFAALALWQLANAVGFMMEAFAEFQGGRATPRLLPAADGCPVRRDRR